METILIIVAVVFGLLIALLAVPIDLAFNLERSPQTRGEVSGRINVRWLFGLLRFAVDIPEKNEPDRLIQQLETTVEKQSKASGGKIKPERFVKLLKQEKFRQRLFKFLKDLLAASHYRDLFLRLRIGVGDPAETGYLWILLGPLSVMARKLRGATVRIEPEFMDPAFELQSHGKFRFIPLEFIALTIAFALSPQSLRAWRTLAAE